jgi:hypothetical protein
MRLRYEGWNREQVIWLMVRIREGRPSGVRQNNLRVRRNLTGGRLVKLLPLRGDLGDCPTSGVPTSAYIQTMNTNPIGVVVLTLGIASCNGVRLPGSQPSAPYLPVLEQGLTAQHDCITFPRGRVQIMGAMSSQMEAADWNQLKFQIQYLTYLQSAQTNGLLTVTEEQQNSLERIRNMGARFFKVVPTDKLSQMQAATNSDIEQVLSQWLHKRDRIVAVQIGTIKVLQILKDEEYKPRVRVGGAGDEFRLVLGTVRDTPTQQAKTLGRYFATIEPQELKFRAVLQFNPFAKTYKYVTADVGNPQDAGWKTETVK